MTTILNSVTEEGFQKCFEHWKQRLRKCAAAWRDNLKGDSDYGITLYDNHCQSLHTGQLRYTHDHSPAIFPTLYWRVYESSCSCSDHFVWYMHAVQPPQKASRKFHQQFTNMLKVFKQQVPFYDSKRTCRRHWMYCIHIKQMWFTKIYNTNHEARQHGEMVPSRNAYWEAEPKFTQFSG